MDIGQVIREFREQANMSQVDIENKTGLQRSHISRIENGVRIPDIDTLMRISHAMNKPAWILLREAEKRLGFLNLDERM